MVLKKLIYILLGIIVCIVGYLYFYTDVFNKQLSPKDSVEFKINDLKIEIEYNRPFKRNRKIFGGLIPYNEVWRTGANEATTFKVNKPIIINGTQVPAGKYTLWTIPGPDSWEIILNTKQYPWGVNEAMQASREPEFDIVIATVKTQQLQEPVEQFTIGFDNSTSTLFLTMAWDTVKVALPIQY